MLKTSSDKTGCCQTSSRSFAASPKATSSGSTGGSFYSETSATMKKKSLVWIICSRCPWCGRTTCSWAAGQKHKHWPGIICWHAFTWRFCEIQTRECEKEKSESWDKSPWRKQAYYEMLNCLHLLCNICDNLPRRTFMKVLVLRTPFSGSFSFRFIIYICVYVYIYIRLTRRAVFQLYYQFPDLLLKDHVLSCFIICPKCLYRTFLSFCCNSSAYLLNKRVSCDCSCSHVTLQVQPRAAGESERDGWWDWCGGRSCFQDQRWADQTTTTEGE